MSDPVHVSVPEPDPVPEPPLPESPVSEPTGSFSKQAAENGMRTTAR